MSASASQISRILQEQPRLRSNEPGCRRLSAADTCSDSISSYNRAGAWGCIFIVKKETDESWVTPKWCQRFMLSPLKSLNFTFFFTLELYTRSLNLFGTWSQGRTLTEMRTTRSSNQNTNGGQSHSLPLSVTQGQQVKTGRSQHALDLNEGQAHIPRVFVLENIFQTEIWVM